MERLRDRENKEKGMEDSCTERLRGEMEGRFRGKVEKRRKGGTDYRRRGTADHPLPVPPADMVLLKEHWLWGDRALPVG